MLKNSKQNHNLNNYKMLVEFAQFLRQNGDKLFEKDSKLCLKTEQIYVLQEYLQQIVSNNRGNSEILDQKYPKRKNTSQSLSNNKEFILLYKSNQLHLIQDFLFKITSLKITSDLVQNVTKDYVKLNIFGSLTYLEVKNIPILNIYDLENLRKQLEVLITYRSISKLQDLLHLCGADQSSPLSWSKLHTLNLSYNNLTSLDNSLRLATSIEILDLSHNSLKTCENFLQNLPKLKRLNLSFNKLEKIPDLCKSVEICQLEYLDISYNNIENLDAENLSKLASLKNINLSNNIISTNTQLNHLRVLPNIKEIYLDGNPVNLNSQCNFLIQDILNVVKVKNSLKKTPQLTNINWSNFQNYQQPSTTSKKLIKTPNIKDLSGLKSTENQTLSLPDSTNFENYLKPNKLKNRSGAYRLKPNNILIEQTEGEISDYILINRKHVESDSDQEPTQLSSSLLSNHFQSEQLQNELDYYKKMRQKYGTGWLSVLPNEANEQTIKVKKEKSKEKLNDRNKTEINLENTQLPNVDFNIIETFLVYRTIDMNQIDQLLNTQIIYNDNENYDKSNEASLNILCLGEKYLLEKDETNSQVLAQYEYSNFSEIIDISRIKKFVQETTYLEENKNQIKIKFKDLSSSRIYEFENNDELNSFIGCISQILFNKINIEKCDLYFCAWCKEFGKKSKFTLDESNENLSNEEIHNLDDHRKNLTCTKCHKYLIKDSDIVEYNPKILLTPKNSREGSPTTDSSINIKDVVIKYNDNKLDSESNSITTNHDDTLSLVSSNQDSEIHENETIEQRLRNVLSNSNQISKIKLDEITNRARKINNNLKLYLIINILGEMKKNESIDESEESLICAYKLKYLFYSVTKLCNQCLCVFTNRHLIVFQINDAELFHRNVDFEKCITKVACIDINQIEIIEIAFAQNYLILNVLNNEDTKLLYKLVTNDVYLNQTLLNTLLKTINESKKVTMLKQIKKKNEVTNRNLEEIVNLVEHVNLGVDEFHIFSSRLNMFLYIEDLQINDNNALIEESTYENFSYAMFLYNNERILFIEENLSYVSTLNKNEQFTLIGSARTSDIVQLKLFREDETKIEISTVDEANNSTQVNWIIKMNKSYQLSQFISLIKEIWEKIFFIELPINF
ncbi:unnamed protein product [Brachionus calyciflorus]|uniref:STK11-interacting protein C-terminal PH domain-containing protein n=1 Tax=Brachionus calyciflorus TaxID=104777 RepID=A0A813Q152_9BILA|nr:unnamed protein product [Brachionus calyciflorus]